MKKFVIKSIIMALIVTGIVAGAEALSMDPRTKAVMTKLTNSEDYAGEESGTADIVFIIRKAKEADDTTVLVIGDSIARQMLTGLQEECPEVKIDCANAAVNISGQYMLAAEYLNSHPGATDVWLFAHPLTLTRTYDLELGYGYAVMPFAMEDSLKYLDDETIDQMASVYGRVALNGTVADLINRSTMNRKLFSTYIRMNSSEYEQGNSYEIASHYLIKLKQLCDEKGVTLHFYSSPSTEYYRDKIEETRADFEASEFSEIFPDYLDGIYYFPTEWSNDCSHFGGDYADRETYDLVLSGAYDEFFTDL